MAPMGWSVGSAVTAAMLTGAIQQVVTAAAILAGQVSVCWKTRDVLLRLKLWKHNYHTATFMVYVSVIWHLARARVHFEAHCLVMQTVALYWCSHNKPDFHRGILFLYSSFSFCTTAPSGAPYVYKSISDRCLCLVSCNCLQQKK